MKLQLQQQVKFLLILIIPFAITSCEKAIDVDIEETSKKIVVNAVATPGDSLLAIVSTSKSIVSNDVIPMLTDAKLSLFEDGLEVSKGIQKTDGRYLFEYEIKDNSTYKIDISHSVLQDVTMMTSTTTSVPISTIKLLPQEEGQTVFKVNFNDPLNEANYYLLSATYYGKDYVWETGDVYYHDRFMYYNLELLQGQEKDLPYFEGNGMSGYAFSDTFFDGTNFTLKVVSYDYFPENTPLKFHLHSLSEEYYNYIYSRNLYQMNQGNPFSQPVQVFSNVEKGIGIFGSYSTSTDSISIAW